MCVREKEVDRVYGPVPDPYRSPIAVARTLGIPNALPFHEGRAVFAGLKGILSAVGETPLVELERLIPGFSSRVYAKTEWFNPGGSIKDRSALSMLLDRIRSASWCPEAPRSSSRAR